MRGVAATQRLGLVERRTRTHSHEHVLQRRATPVVDVDVAGCDARHAETARELGEQAVATAVMTRERALKLDPEPVLPECAQQALGDTTGARVLAAFEPRCHGALTGTAGETDETVGVLLEVGERDVRLLRLAPRHRTRRRM